MTQNDTMCFKLYFRERIMPWIVANLPNNLANWSLSDNFSYLTPSGDRTWRTMEAGLQDGWGVDPSYYTREIVYYPHDSLINSMTLTQSNRDESLYFTLVFDECEDFNLSSLALKFPTLEKRNSLKWHNITLREESADGTYTKTSVAVRMKCDDNFDYWYRLLSHIAETFPDLQLMMTQFKRSFELTILSDCSPKNKKNFLARLGYSMAPLGFNEQKLMPGAHSYLPEECYCAWSGAVITKPVMIRGISNYWFDENILRHYFRYLSELSFSSFSEGKQSFTMKQEYQDVVFKAKDIVSPDKQNLFYSQYVKTLSERVDSYAAYQRERQLKKAQEAEAKQSCSSQLGSI